MATSQRRVMWYANSKNVFLPGGLYSYEPIIYMPHAVFQWSFGVVMWEVFSGGKAPYPGTDPVTLLQWLETGQRMPKPYNSACTDEM